MLSSSVRCNNYRGYYSVGMSLYDCLPIQPSTRCNAQGRHSIVSSAHFGNKYILSFTFCTTTCMSAQDLLVLELKKGICTCTYLHAHIMYVRTFIYTYVQYTQHCCRYNPCNACISYTCLTHDTTSPPLQHTGSVPNQEHLSPHIAPRPVGGTRERGGSSNIKRGGVHGYHIL